MNILLVSECSGRALNETRRILDQFAERRGERTWQTPITRDGLDTLRKLLRKTARKNTAVACHWIRGINHSELLWIVGSAVRFNAQGAVPTNTTRFDVLRTADENDWHTGEDIALLAQLAGLLHDLGKASIAFQARLRAAMVERNLYRHEWVSLRLFCAFVGDDDDAGWLARLANPDAADDAAWTAAGRYWRDGLDADAPPPFATLPPLAAAVAWLVVTHHRLPVIPVRDERDGGQKWLGAKESEANVKPKRIHHLLSQVAHDWNELRQSADAASIAPYWQFEHGLPITSAAWRKRAAKLAIKLQALRDKPGKGDWLSNPYVMHLARLSLMLADHDFSRRSLPAQGALWYANTDRKTGALNQALDIHLLGVADGSAKVVHSLPQMAQRLPSLTRHKGLRKRAVQARFRWQDAAADAAEAMRTQAAEHGAFVINMASTGCGKTLANARILYALAEPQRGARCTFALGLRTLTLQTGRSYRDDLHLGDDELAILVGGSANRALFEYYEQLAERSGSASTQALIEEDSHVLYEGNADDDGVLSRAMADPQIRKLLAAPMLVCTIDHIVPATEAQRGGRQIAPMLRLLSSDLVLDELDDFDIADLPAVARLMHWAGLLGTRVVISSATLPPALVEGMFAAYRAGRLHHQRNRGMHGGQPTSPPDIACLWVDEFKSVRASCIDTETFTQAHADFVEARVRSLGKTPPVRRGEIVPVQMARGLSEEVVHHAYAARMQDTVLRAHAAHAQTCPVSGKRVSFGLVRMANIEPIIGVAQALYAQGAPENHRIHLCVYHARMPLAQRSAIEHRLDQALDRRAKDAVFDLPEIRHAIDTHPEREHLFVVLASPVAEVGRDHDYDWAVVEPSSMRSIIQLAGRVQRHRRQPCTSANIFLLDANVRHFIGEANKAVFLRPGFEQMGPTSDPHRLMTHRLEKLLRSEEWQTISAKPRIRPQDTLAAKRSLVDLEHARLRELMQSGSDRLNAASAWESPQAGLTWALPQQQRFRDDSASPEETLVYLPNDEEDVWSWHYIHAGLRRGQPDIYVACDRMIKEFPLPIGERIAPWVADDLSTLIQAHAEAQDLSLLVAAKRFSIVQVNQSERGWWHHPALGFWRQR